RCQAIAGLCPGPHRGAAGVDPYVRLGGGSLARADTPGHALVAPSSAAGLVAPGTVAAAGSLGVECGGGCLSSAGPRYGIVEAARSSRKTQSGGGFINVSRLQIFTPLCSHFSRLSNVHWDRKIG